MFWVNFCGVEMFGCHLNQYLQSAQLSQSPCVKWNLILRRRTRLRKKPNNQCEYSLYLIHKSFRDNVIVDNMLCKYQKDANWSTGQLFLQIDAVDNYWKLWQLVVLRVFVDPFFTIIAIFGCGNLFWANLTNFGFGWFVWKINKLLLRTPFLHIVQMFGFGHLFFKTCR